MDLTSPLSSSGGGRMKCLNFSPYRQLHLKETVGVSDDTSSVYSDMSCCRNLEDMVGELLFFTGGMYLPGLMNNLNNSWLIVKVKNKDNACCKMFSS